ncbi:MAG: hypothetical protein K2N08_05955, partial [Muribaculaceae bacterium]|nr:hypothetical protein [Muribaculaceae bacterium]
MKSTIIYSLFLLLLLSGCGKSDSRLYLESINTVIETDPRLAISKLDSIKDREFNNSDRAYFNLLTIKSHDKAYIKHKNDSLIKEVLAFYENNQGADFAEALYYGGRVYSDIGNYPTSLNYFHRALDELPDNDANRRLRGQVVSQLGRLLIELRLYSQAIPYLEKSIEYDKLDQDSFSLAFDYELLSGCYLGKKEYTKAEECINRAISIGTNLGNENLFTLKNRYADVKLKKGESDSALILFRVLIDSIPKDSEPYFWADASQVYYKNGIYDTAYIYAKKIINDHRQACKNIAYFILLKPEIKKLIPVDSLLIYYRDYESYINEYLNRHDSEQALIQTSMYNYELHERESKEAKSSRDRILKMMVLLLIITLIFIILTLYFKLRVRTREIELNNAKKRIGDLLSELELLTRSVGDDENSGYEDSIQAKREELLSIAEQNIGIESIADIKLNEVYNKLLSKIENGGMIDYDFWMEIETQVNLKFPNFIKNLQFLSGSSLNEIEIKTCYLIKVGLKPTQISKILSITKGSVSSRREGIGIRLLGEKTSVPIVDRVIK